MNAGRLQGVGIVVTRPRHAAEPLAAQLMREGARVFVFPSLAVEAIEPSAAAQATLTRLPQADMAIFVSANAVERGLALVSRNGAWPVGVRVAAIGEATAEALRNSGFASVISPPERHDSDALLEHAELQVVEGLHIIVFRGVGGRERLREGLQARGARVEYLECYRRLRPQADPAPLLQAWQRDEIQAVSVLSAETLENFVALAGADAAPFLAGATLVVPHPAVGRHPDADRFARVVVAGTGAAALAEALSPLQVHR